MAFSRDHADSPSSPLLSTALIRSHDAITGFWDGRRTVQATAKALQSDLTADLGYLDKIRPSHRALLLGCLLKGEMRVTGKDGEATLEIQQKAITTLKRPDPELFEDQLGWVRAYADLRADRLEEIQMQLDDMLSFFGALGLLDDGRRDNTLRLLDVTRAVTIHVETPVKFYCRAPRPIDYAMEVQPMIQTPDHSSFPSGHAMEAFAIATVFYRLSTGKGPEEGMGGPDGIALPFRLAHRIATNRTVAGVHFPVDSSAGAFMGCMVGEAIHALSGGGDPDAGTKSIPKGEWTGIDLPPGGGNDNPPRSADFLLPVGDLSSGGTKTVDVLKVAAELWRRAAAEWPK